MGGIKVAASRPAADSFLAYSPNWHCHNIRWLGDASRFSFFVFVIMDCSWVVRQSSYHRRLFCTGRIWDVARRPRQKHKKVKNIMKFSST